MMKNSILSLAAGSLLLLSSAISLHAEDAAAARPLKIDIPVDLKEAKVVFNMDQPAFAGDASIGLTYMKLMTQNFDRSKTEWTIKSVFHGAMGPAPFHIRRYVMITSPFISIAHEGLRYLPSESRTVIKTL